MKITDLKPHVLFHRDYLIGQDPLDVGGLAEIKWIAEYADLHGVPMAPHGIGNGLLGLAASLQVSATMPDNLIAFECPTASTEWWPDIAKGLPEQHIVDGTIEVWDRAARYLEPEDEGFFD